MGMSEIHWSVAMGIPILGIMQLLPLAAMLMIMALRRRGVADYLALAFSLIEFLLALVLYLRFDSSRMALQFAERTELLPVLVYHAAVDGVSVMFLLLTTLLTILVQLYGINRKVGPRGRFHGALFAIQATLIGMFTTQDLLWFFLLSVAQLGIAGYMLWRWSTAPDRDLALARYLQFMGTGLLLLFVGTMMLGWNHADITGGEWSFELHRLVREPLQGGFGSLVFFLLFYGLAIRIPLFPLHGWLPIAAEHGSIAIALVFLLGLKVGVYGLIHFVFPLMPDIVIQWHRYVVTIAVAGIFYAAVLALMQVNLRRLLAFAVVSHTSVLVIGLFSLNLNAFQGSVMLSVNFGLATAGLLFMSGFVYQRTGTMLLAKMGGLFDRIPYIGIAFLVSALSIVGMPGTPGFDAVHLMMEAAIKEFGALFTVAAAVGNVVAAGFLLWAFQRIFLAPRQAGAMLGRTIGRTSGVELLLIGALLTVLLFAGFFSGPWLELTNGALEGLDARFGHVHHE